MARWDPGAEERLKAAAIALCLEHGYDAVTVTQIAERAGLTRRSFFRYFPDKREVFFGGSDRLPPALTEAVASADGSLDLLQAVTIALVEVGEALLREVEGAKDRSVVIAGSRELQERERTKMADVARAATEGLRQRGADDATARLLGRVAVAVFETAFAQSIEDDDPAGSIAAHVNAEFSRLAKLIDG
ncbi:TetR family transcriptional regulator [Spelaeicoccus albus]|uniref:AcrR family transcriptional regulator n=1 Tax=Spelaeicoccus albus TaxID=1280376 RepID=A0A7Z0D563_9MICO|nr:TetR family transcriptional regulator [Spelaeicoccus albus]NYI69031.1 AcrR family transcriptional regulator [Spelaeicoccus albus]